MAQASPTASKGPNGMEKVLNEEPRDSGFFTNDSKHTSMNSTSALTPSSGGYQSSPVNHTPSPIATNMEPTGGLPLVSPASAMSVAAMVSPTTAEHAAMGRQYESGYDSLRNSGGYMNGDSRRESVGSSVHGMDALRLNGGSPYASNNPSTSSLQETLQQQRNPGAGERPGFSSRFSNSYQPATARTPEVNGSYGRKAPAITGPTPGPIARAGEATKGHAWAFPDSEALKAPSAIHPNNNTPAAGYQDSRRSSFASASSQYTTESKYPPSQRRLEDGMPADYNRLSHASSEFPGAQQHHHHQLARLQSEEASSPTGSSQPYSRTPELRVTHKLAERKRRTEMKELFERLANNLPSDGRSTKSSKWETLSKAITEIDRLKPYERMCQQLQAQLAAASQEIQSRDSKIQSLLAERHQDKQFMEQLQAQLAQGPGNGYNTNHTNGNGQYTRTDAPPMADPAGRERFFPPAPPAIGPPKSTLPLRASARGVQLPSINNAVGPSYSGAQPMSGVEYASPGSGSYEQPRHQF